MKQILSTTLLVALLMIVPMEKSFASENPTLGEITIFAGNFAPRGWAFCEGQLMPINENQSLYSVIGITYGGDERVNFALPDLREAEKSLNGARYIISINGLYPSRS